MHSRHIQSTSADSEKSSAGSTGKRANSLPAVPASGQCQLPQTCGNGVVQGVFEPRTDSRILPLINNDRTLLNNLAQLKYTEEEVVDLLENRMCTAPQVLAMGARFSYTETLAVEALPGITTWAMVADMAALRMSATTIQLLLNGGVTRDQLAGFDTIPGFDAAILPPALRDMITPGLTAVQARNILKFSEAERAVLRGIPSFSTWDVIATLGSLTRLPAETVALASMPGNTPTFDNLRRLEGISLDFIRQLAALPQTGGNWTHILTLCNQHRPIAQTLQLASLQVGAGNVPNLPRICALDPYPFHIIRDVVARNKKTLNWPQIMPLLDKASRAAAKVGKEISSAMAIANSGIFQYPGYQQELMSDQERMKYRRGYLDPRYWNHVMNGPRDRMHCSFTLKPGVRASVAIKHAFENDARLECLSTSRAVQARAMLAFLGPAKFDALFQPRGGKKPVLFIGVHPPPGLYDPIIDMLKKKPVTRLEDLQPGDKIYYENDPRYRIKHPGGSWRGENLIYDGFIDGKHTFSGFGMKGITEPKLKQDMINAFDEPSDVSGDFTNPVPVGFKFDTVISFDYAAVASL